MRLENWFYTVPLRLRSVFHRQQAEQDLDDELNITWIGKSRKASPGA